MNTDRVNKLQKLLEDSPNDPFLKYALALEFIDQDTEYTCKLFTELLKDHPDYTPTYYHAAILFTDLGNYKRAEEIYLTGMEKTHDEPKAKQELSNAYQNFLFEFGD